MGSLKKEMEFAESVRQQDCGQLNEKTVYVGRVAKVVKGGKRFSFSALIVAGDGQGAVGVGLGKSGEVPDAIRKGGERARKSLMKVPMVGSTIPHEVVGKCGPTSVLMRPAAPGTGIIAGLAVRAVLESAGIRDVRTKVIGSKSAHNVVGATISGLLKLVDPKQFSRVLGKEAEALGYHPYEKAS